ncbi:MAG: signal peptidase II [Caloramator sp.]|nr:signal peptidase II [Caloramator sp.]
MQIIYIILLVIIDHITKYIAKMKLSSGKFVPLIDGFLELIYVENRGAAFGIFKNKKFFLVGITTFVVLGMIYYLLKTTNLNKWERISLIFIISGAVGNLIDRIFRGYVVDFIHFYIKDIFDWPVFNIADILVVVGAIILAFSILFFKNDGVVL